jgi:hypothetical protein
MIADCLVSETFEDGDVVLNQGDTEEMPKLYLVRGMGFPVKLLL